MSADTLASRPTVETVTAAHAAFSWAFRHDSKPMLAHLETLDEQGLAGVEMAVSLLAAGVAEARNRRAMEVEAKFPLPAGLEYPGDQLARRLVFGGWSAHEFADYRDLPRAPRSADDGCSAAVEPCRTDQTAWECTHHVPGWHVAVGTAVVAVWPRVADECQCDPSSRVYCHADNCHGGSAVGER